MAQIYFVHQQLRFVIFSSNSTISQINVKSQKSSLCIKKVSKLTQRKNFRPMSLLQLVSKIIERTIHDQTMNFLSDSNVLYKYQSGFRNIHSTDTCLSYFHDKITKGFDSGLLTGMVLIDLQKTFDTIDHNVLIKKMPFLGFDNFMRQFDETIQQYTLYLSKRKFIISMENAYSDKASITCDVPQGSILGPLLFLIYINDMPQDVDSEFLLYADDPCLFFQRRDIKTIEQHRLNRHF